MSPATQRVVKSLVRTIAPNVLSVLVLALAHFGLSWTPDADALLLTQQILAYAIFALLRTLEERGHKRAGFLLGWAGPPRYEKAPPLSSEDDQPTKPSERRTPEPPQSESSYPWHGSQDRFARLARSRGRTGPIRRRRASAAMLAVLAALAASLTVSPPARAELYGLNVRWASTDIPVKVHVHDVSGPRVKDGVHFWDVTNVHPIITGGSCLDSAGIPQGCVDISDGAVMADPSWVAQAERYTLADGTIVGAFVQFSGAQNWGAGSSLRVLVDDIAAHEVGHAFGHAHTLDLSIPSEMQPTARDWNGLQPFDKSEDLRLYPFPVSAAAVTGKHYRADELHVQRFGIRAR